MTIGGFFVSRLLDAIDFAFDAAASLMRVLLRGSFTPDASSYRGERFARLDADQILVQEIAVNAGDEEEARKAVALDPDRYLPLASDAALFDVAGPLEGAEALRSRPESTFLIGVLRKDAIAGVRASLPGGRRGGVEQFIYTPPAAPDRIFRFGDETGARTRRSRRLLTALSLSLCVYASFNAFASWRAALDRVSAQAEAVRSQAERRTRLAERHVQETHTAIAALAHQPGIPLVDFTQTLSRLALHLPQAAQIDEVEFRPDGLDLHGKTYAPEATELEFRRAFERRRVDFTSPDGAAPQAFDAHFANEDAP